MPINDGEQSNFGSDCLQFDSSQKKTILDQLEFETSLGFAFRIRLK
jgi:hypothetical protein